MSGGLETEYKFLVKHDGWKQVTPLAIHHICQHYVPEGAESVIRLHVAKQDESYAIMAQLPDQRLTLPIPQEVVANFGVEHLRHLANSEGQIIIGKPIEARIRQLDAHYLLTIKVDTEHKASRRELEFLIQAEDAAALITYCPHSVEKIRHMLMVDGNRWEVDVFQGKNTGLVTVEIEADTIPEQKPDWVGENIDGVHRYSNHQLARIPYSLMGGAERARC